MDDGPDRSTIEIKNLIRKLNPAQGSHKDRVRALTRFRNFASAANSKKGKTTTPTFFDDDLPLLFLGSEVESPTALYDEDQYGDLSGFYGLLQACATPSSDSEGLKRSARNAMNLVKYLALDHVELEDGEPVPLGIEAETGLAELNPFAYVLCSMKASQLRTVHFEQHLRYSGGNSRGGDKGDACKVLVLLLTRSFDPNMNMSSMNGANMGANGTLTMEDLLTTAISRQAFENWMVQNVSKEVQNLIKARTSKADMAANANNAGANNLQTPMKNNPLVNNDDEVELGMDILDAFKKRNMSESERKAVQDAEAHAEEQLGELGLQLYTKDDLESLDGDNQGHEAPTCWKDSKLAKKMMLSSNSTESGIVRGRDGGDGKTMEELALEARDEEKIKQQNEERQKLIGKDPLGIRPETFDLKNLQQRAGEILEHAVQDLAEEMEDDPEESALEAARKKKKKRDKYAYSVEQLVSLGSQKNALEAIINGNGEKDDLSKNEEEGEEKAEKALSVLPAKDLSILSTDANFNPMLFLTLVHRNASYEQLTESIRRLDSEYLFYAYTYLSVDNDSLKLFKHIPSPHFCRPNG